MDKEELRRYKAKKLRYKKPIASDLNLYTLKEWLWDNSELISDVQYFIDDDFNLLNALDGDEDEANEFKLAFSQLASEMEQFRDDLEDQYVSEYFDIFFPAIESGRAFGGYAGYDAYEQDYFGLEPYEYSYAEDEAAKQLMKLTKKEIIKAAGSCLKVATQYLAIRYRYDCLEASLKILQGQNLGMLKVLKALDEQYEKAEKISEGFKYNYHEEVKEFDNMLKEIPQEFWVQ